LFSNNHFENAFSKWKHFDIKTDTRHNFEIVTGIWLQKKIEF